MSEGGGFGVSVLLKGIGFALLCAGILTGYFTFTSMQVLGVFTAFFGFLVVILCVIGVILMTAKTE